MEECDETLEDPGDQEMKPAVRLHLLEISSNLYFQYLNNMAELTRMNDGKPTDRLIWKGGVPQGPSYHWTKNYRQ